MARDAHPAVRAREVLGFSRWWLLAAAVAMMAAVSPYQYAWTALESPIADRLGASIGLVSWTFTLFVVVQSGSQFPVGWWRDRHGPRAVSVLAGVLAGAGYVGTAAADSVPALYLAYSAGAVGAGIVYTVAVNTALKWFPDRKGLTTGLGTMAFGAGGAVFIPYVRANASPAAYPGALQAMGLLVGVLVVAGALVLRDPPGPLSTDGGESPGEAGTAGADVDAAASAESLDVTWRGMVRTWQFWLLYGMFVGVGAAGLLVTAQLVAFAEELEIAAAAITLAAVLVPLASGGGRLVIGALSDRYDRRYITVGSFVACGLGVYGLVAFGHGGAALAFVASAFVATFFWSPQYSLFPSLVAEYYGERHSSANYALLYSGKMWGGVFGGGVAGLLATSVGWTTTFLVGGTLAVASGVAALALRPPDRP